MCQMKIKSDQATKFTICDHISKISSSTVYKKIEIKFNIKNLRNFICLFSKVLSKIHIICSAFPKYFFTIDRINIFIG